MNAVGAQITVTGSVQGVGYRFFCHRWARQLGLGGWVRNRMDGSVEVMAEGDRGSIEVLISQLKVGPSGAVVKGVDVSWAKYSGTYDSFSVTG